MNVVLSFVVFLTIMRLAVDATRILQAKLWL